MSTAHPTEKSGTRTLAIPTLLELIRTGQTDAKQHKQRTLAALDYWFRQSERLNIARTHYRLRGDRFKDFARRIGVDRSSAFGLVKLWKHRPKIMARCLDEAKAAARHGETYHYPGWETALGWFESKRSFVSWPPSGSRRTGDYQLTPPALYQKLDQEFHFDFDPCPHPRPPGWDALTMPWGRVNYVNAPFSREEGPGVTAFVRKGIAEQRLGNTSVFVLPMPELLDLLIAAGAEVRPIGRVPFLDKQTGRPCPRPLCCTAFILRSNSKRR